MKTILIILFSCTTFCAVSQDNSLTQPIKYRYGITVPRGDKRFEMIPASGSERFKMKIEIENDSVLFELKAEIFEKGVSQTPSFDPTAPNMITKIRLLKGENIFFEAVPDTSKVTIMTLYLFFPGMSRSTNLYCQDGQCIKYKRFDIPTSMKEGITSLMLLYVDDAKTSEKEKIVNKYIKNNLVTSNPLKQERLYKELNTYLLLYYNLETITK